MGLYYVTKLAINMGKSGTPGLRDVFYKAPYMHNGALATLAEVVALMTYSESPFKYDLREMSFKMRTTVPKTGG